MIGTFIQCHGTCGDLICTSILPFCVERLSSAIAPSILPCQHRSGSAADWSNARLDPCYFRLDDAGVAFGKRSS
jgi:hypothetical protein